MNSNIAAEGKLGLRLIRRAPVVEPPNGPITLDDFVRLGTPQEGLPDSVNEWRRKNRPNLWKGMRKILAARTLDIGHFYGLLMGRVIRDNGDVEDLGLMSLRVVTNAGVSYLNLILIGTNTAGAFKWHGLGTSNASTENVTDTGLTTEISAGTYSGGARSQGAPTQQGGSGNVYQTQATNTVTGPVSITEHGIFSASASGTLLDKSSFTGSPVGLQTNDSLQTTYQLTINAGG